jgi:hypothetical protein
VYCIHVAEYGDRRWILVNMLMDVVNWLVNSLVISYLANF